MPLDDVTSVIIARSRRATKAIQPANAFFAIPLLDVTSSNVGRIGYDLQKWRLYVQFRDQRVDSRDGTIYAYEGVPSDVFDALIAADENGGSVGREFNRLVKAASYEYRRIG